MVEDEEKLRAYLLAQPNHLNIPEQLITGDKCFELHYDFSRDFAMSSLIGAFFGVQGKQELQDLVSKDYFPVITKVTQIDSDVVEIRRAYIYKRFFNTSPYPEEVIRIDRSKLNKSP